jgi:hypothetical protein
MGVTAMWRLIIAAVGAVPLGAALAAGFYHSAQSKPGLPEFYNPRLTCYNGKVVVTAHHAAFIDLDMNGKPIPCPK